MMDPDRRRQVESVCAEALGLELASRPAFLEAACGSDEELRRLVGDLLARADGFLETAALSGGGADDIPPTAALRLAAGDAVGPYVVESLVGAGGMGEVYRARDARLGRLVAIKVLPAGGPGLSPVSPDAAPAPGDTTGAPRRRFEIEARAASALDHPNICTIYDIGEHEGRPFIAMEWIDGARIDEAIPPGGMDVDRALALARQIAGGLAAAHRAGIVHRDIKPANILLAKDGTAKVVDFGLAKVLPAGGGEGREDTPQYLGVTTAAVESEASSATVTGKQLGTPGYAPPEQIEGRSLDARADVFGFGCVLYELLAAP